MVNIQKTKIILSNHSGRYLRRLRGQGALKAFCNHSALESKSLSFKRSRSEDTLEDSQNIMMTIAFILLQWLASKTKIILNKTLQKMPLKIHKT